MTCFIGSRKKYLEWLNKNGLTLIGKQSINIEDRHNLYKIRGLEFTLLIATDEILLSYNDFIEIQTRLNRSNSAKKVEETQINK